EPPGPVTDRNFSQAQLGFQAAWELDFWGKFRRGIQSADATLQFTVEDYDNALVSLTGDVASTYILIRALEERIRLARQNISLHQTTLELTNLRCKLGAASEPDVAQAKANLASTQALVPQFVQQREQARNRLTVLLGATPAQVDALLGSPASIPKPPSEVAV